MRPVDVVQTEQVEPVLLDHFQQTTVEIPLAEVQVEERRREPQQRKVPRVRVLEGPGEFLDEKRLAIVRVGAYQRDEGQRLQDLHEFVLPNFVNYGLFSVLKEQLNADLSYREQRAHHVVVGPRLPREVVAQAVIWLHFLPLKPLNYNCGKN